MSNTFTMKSTRELKVQLSDAKVLVMGKRPAPKVHAALPSQIARHKFVFQMFKIKLHAAKLKDNQLSCLRRMTLCELISMVPFQIQHKCWMWNGLECYSLSLSVCLPALHILISETKSLQFIAKIYCLTPGWGTNNTQNNRAGMVYFRIKRFSRFETTTKTSWWFSCIRKSLMENLYFNRFLNVDREVGESDVKGGVSGVSGVHCCNRKYWVTENYLIS